MTIFFCTHFKSKHTLSRKDIKVILPIQSHLERKSQWNQGKKRKKERKKKKERGNVEGGDGSFFLLGRLPKKSFFDLVNPNYGEKIKNKRMRKY